MQLLRSYSLPINFPVSALPTLFESLFRIPWLQDMKVRLFMSTLNALHSLILLPICPYKACAVRGCLGSHPLWIGVSRRAECPLLIGNLQMDNEPSQTDQPNQIANPTDHHTKLCVISRRVCYVLWTWNYFYHEITSKNKPAAKLAEESLMQWRAIPITCGGNGSEIFILADFPFLPESQSKMQKIQAHAN